MSSEEMNLSLLLALLARLALLAQHTSECSGCDQTCVFCTRQMQKGLRILKLHRCALWTVPTVPIFLAALFPAQVAGFDAAGPGPTGSCHMARLMQTLRGLGR